MPAGGYNYKIVPVNTEGLECTPVEISAQSIMPLYEIGNPVLTDENGNIVDKISDSGEYTISIPVKNNKLEDGMSVEIFASVCVENGLRKLYTNHKILSVNEADDMEITLEVTDSDTKIEFYVFDSREGMNVLYPYVAYTK